MSVTYNCKYGIVFINEFNGRAVINYRKPKFRNFSSQRYGLPEINKKVKLKFSLSLTTTTRNGILDLIKNNYLENLKMSKDVVEALMLAQKSNSTKALVSSKKVSKLNSKILNGRKKIKIGIIGSGYMAREHIKVLKNIKKNRSNRGSIKKFKKTEKFASKNRIKFFSSIDQLYNKPTRCVYYCRFELSLKGFDRNF